MHGSNSLNMDKGDNTDTSTQNGNGSNIKREEKFSFLSLCGIAFSTGESWIALGNSLSLALYNGGPSGVLYGFIADSACYWLVAASVAELASSMPSTATVYEWSRVTGGKYGRITSWYAGWWSCLAWQVGVASLVSFLALQILGVYSICHPDFEVRDWHIFCTYIACNWILCLLVLFGDRWLAMVESWGLLFTLAGWLISVMICVAMPKVHRKGYASNAAVWTHWKNQTKWSSDGFVFCLGMLNAAFAVCAPDIPCHLAEEIPHARRNVPLAIMGQYISSFCTGFIFLIALFYATPDLETVMTERSVFPLSRLYLEATSPATAVGLLALCMLNTILGIAGVFAIAGRQIWALAREQAVPCWGTLGQLHSQTQAPFRAILLVGFVSTGLGCLYLVSSRAFNAITGSFVVSTSLAYLAAVLPHLLSGRRNVPKGPFWMAGGIGFVVNSLSCIYLVAFAVIFCFPETTPVTGANMNYAAVIVVAWTLLATGWWCLKGSLSRCTAS